MPEPEDKTTTGTQDQKDTSEQSKNLNESDSDIIFVPNEGKDDQPGTSNRSRNGGKTTSNASDPDIEIIPTDKKYDQPGASAGPRKRRKAATENSDSDIIILPVEEKDKQPGTLEGPRKRHKAATEDSDQDIIVVPTEGKEKQPGTSEGPRKRHIAATEPSDLDIAILPVEEKDKQSSTSEDPRKHHKAVSKTLNSEVIFVPAQKEDDQPGTSDGPRKRRKTITKTSDSDVIFVPNQEKDDQPGTSDGPRKRRQNVPKTTDSDVIIVPNQEEDDQPGTSDGPEKRHKAASKTSDSDVIFVPAQKSDDQPGTSEGPRKRRRVPSEGWEYEITGILLNNDNQRVIVGGPHLNTRMPEPEDKKTPGTGSQEETSKQNKISNEADPDIIFVPVQEIDNQPGSSENPKKRRKTSNESDSDIIFVSTEKKIDQPGTSNGSRKGKYTSIGSDPDIAIIPNDEKDDKPGTSDGMRKRRKPATEDSDPDIIVLPAQVKNDQPGTSEGPKKHKTATEALDPDIIVVPTEGEEKLPETSDGPRKCNKIATEDPDPDIVILQAQGKVYQPGTSEGLRKRHKAAQALDSDVIFVPAQEEDDQPGTSDGPRKRRITIPITSDSDAILVPKDDQPGTSDGSRKSRITIPRTSDSDVIFVPEDDQPGTSDGPRKNRKTVPKTSDSDVIFVPQDDQPGTSDGPRKRRRVPSEGWDYEITGFLLNKDNQRVIVGGPHLNRTQRPPIRCNSMSAGKSRHLPPSVTTKESKSKEYPNEILEVAHSGAQIEYRGLEIPKGLERVPYRYSKNQEATKDDPKDKARFRASMAKHREFAKYTKKNPTERFDGSNVAIIPDMVKVSPEKYYDYDPDAEGFVVWEPPTEEMDRLKFPRFWKYYWRAIWRQFENKIDIDMALRHLMRCRYVYCIAMESIDRLLKIVPQQFKPICESQYRVYHQMMLDGELDRGLLREKALRNYHLGEVHEFYRAYKRYHRSFHPKNQHSYCDNFNNRFLVFSPRWACSNCHKKYKTTTPKHNLCVMCQTFTHLFEGRIRWAKNPFFTNDELGKIKRWVDLEKELGKVVPRHEFEAADKKKTEDRQRLLELTEEEKEIINWDVIPYSKARLHPETLTEVQKKEVGEMCVKQLVPHPIPHFTLCPCKDLRQKKVVKPKRPAVVTDVTEAENGEGTSEPAQKMQKVD